MTRLLLSISLLTGCACPIMVPIGDHFRVAVRLDSGPLEDCITPRARWTRDELSLDLKMDDRCGDAPAVALPRVPSPPSPGLWTVQIVHAELGSSDTQTLLALPAWAYTLLILPLLAALFLLGRTQDRRLLLGLALTGPLWVPILAYRLWAYAALLVALGTWERLRPGQRAAVCIALSVFLEGYWGQLVNENELHGFIISATIAGGVGLLLRRWWQATLAWLALLSLFQVTMSVYEAFFLDFPAASTLDQMNQAGNVLTSIGPLIRPEHLLTLLLPLSLLRIRRDSQPDLRPSGA